MWAYAVFYFVVSIGWLYVFRAVGGRLKMGTLWGAFLAGLIAGPFAGLASAQLESSLLAGSVSNQFHFRDFLLFFFIVGPVEEGLKFLGVFFASHRKPDFQTALDGMLLAVAGALGFAGGENVVYLFAYGVEGTLLRLFLGNLGHAAYSVFWGYAFGAVLHEDAPVSLILAGLGVAAFFHGAYDYLLTLSVFGAVLAFLLSGVLWFFLFSFLRSESRR